MKFFIGWIKELIIQCKKPPRKIEDVTCGEIYNLYLALGYRRKTSRDPRKPICNCCDYETNTRNKRRSIYTGGLL